MTGIKKGTEYRIISQCHLNIRYVTDATVAVLIAVLLFILPSTPPTLCCWPPASPGPGGRHLTTPKMMNYKVLCMSLTHSFGCMSLGIPMPALLTWKVAQRKMPWNIVLLLGGGFALAKGSEVIFNHIPFSPPS